MRKTSRNYFDLILLLTIFLSSLTSVRAETIIPPPGLEAGDQYRLVFLTTGTRDAMSSDIEDYNAFVQQHADESPLAALGVNWKAVVSTSTVSARDNTSTNPETAGEGFPIYRVDGERVDRNYASLWDHEMTPHLNITEFGEPFPFDPQSEGVETWSGSLTRGRIGNTPEFTEALGTETPITGNATIGGVAAWTNGRDDATALHHIIGMSDLLTVPVPEPAFHLSWLLLLIVRRRRTR